MHTLLRPNRYEFITQSGSASHALNCPSQPPAVINPAQLQAEVDHFHRSQRLPGLSVVLVDHTSIHSACSGQRRIDAPTLIQNTDACQLGALSKAVTATLIARWVAQGKLRWDSTLADLLPAWRDQMRSEFQSVTVLQLLQHRAGLARDFCDLDYPSLLPMLGGHASADRSTAARWILQQASAGKVNREAHYSNLGYLIVGIIIELLGGNTYENVLQQHLLPALHLHPTFSNTTPIQGHRYITKKWFGKPSWQVSDQNDADLQRLAKLDPASRLSLSLPDYGVFLREHLLGLQGKSTLLNQACFQKLHTPIDHYALGWSVIDSAQLGSISVHDSTEHGRTNYTLLIPSQNRAVAVMCNGESARSGAKLVKFAESLLA